METTIGDITIRLVQGDITEQDVDVVVNAANSSLLGGGGVDGAIHRKGGHTILEACKAIRNARGSLPTGEAVITTAGDLPASAVVHTVGPVWQGGTHSEFIKLENAYLNSLELAKDEGHRTVAFPSISTGAYKFPIKRAAHLAANTIFNWARQNEGALDEVRMVLFSEEDLAVYTAEFEDVLTTQMG